MKESNSKGVESTFVPNKYMKVNTGNIFFHPFLMVIVLCLSTSGIFAQSKAENKIGEFCTRTDIFNTGTGVTVRELREMIVPARSLLTVDVKRHGNISVRGDRNRPEILVRACLQAWGTSDKAARERARIIDIGMGSVIRAESGGVNEDVWAVSSISYEILVPRNTNLNLSTWNGNISISNVEGTIRFKALNGNLGLRNLAGDVRGRTTNGNVSVALSGNLWTGKEFDVETTNGNVDLNISENYAASLDIGTGMGDIIGNIYQKAKTNGGLSGKQIRAFFNGGGSPIRVRTAVGNVSLRYSAKLR
jgi:hypothetical protein